MRVGIIRTVGSPCRCGEAVSQGIEALGHEPLLYNSEEIEACVPEIAQCDLVIDHTDTLRGRGLYRALVRCLLESHGARLVGSDARASFLADDKGMTLYLYTKDSPGTTVCYDKCATAWPPLLTSGNAVAGDGVDASKFGTTTRTDGGTQVTYNGWPLYYYIKDKQAGDITGQGVGSVWYLVSPTGDAIK